MRAVERTPRRTDDDLGPALHEIIRSSADWYDEGEAGMSSNAGTATSGELVDVFDELGEVSIPDVGIGRSEHALTRAASSLALASHIGRVVLAGSSSSGSNWVQFNVDGGGGYASSWPQWAFSIARDALLHNTKVWVIANGDPFGSNLTQVLLYRP
jgi:hypothetical protein